MNKHYKGLLYTHIDALCLHTAVLLLIMKHDLTIELIPTSHLFKRDKN